MYGPGEGQVIAAQLSVRRGRAAIEFYKAAFGAVEDYQVGGTQVYPAGDAHGWRLGRIEDPFGHHWEIGRPLLAWPPAPGSPDP
jgi:uncharacterized glyoxalase superfamily protein PhnB